MPRATRRTSSIASITASPQLDSLHLNLNYSRSWFQTPNAYDNLNVQNVVSGGTSANPAFDVIGDTDQRSKIGTFNIAPTYTRVISNNAVFNFGAYVRKDPYNYYPSNNPLADLGPIQTHPLHRTARLTNAGVRSDITYVKGIQNIKGGAHLSADLPARERQPRRGRRDLQRALRGSATATRCPDTLTQSACDGVASFPNPDYLPVLAPYDLTRGGGFYSYFGHTDVKELALYIEDQIKAGNWNFNLGIRGDIYNGLTERDQAEPRLGIAYNIKPSRTVLRVSYARTLETPFNENLVLSSQGCLNAVLSPLLACTPGVSGTLAPGYRNEFHAGLQQAFGKWAVFSGEYIWKYTHNAFDFGVLGNTPIYFPHRLA